MWTRTQTVLVGGARAVGSSSSAGTYTLLLGVAQGAQDTDAPSALLVDNIQVTPPLLISEPQERLLLLTAIGVLAGVWARARRR